MLQRTGEAETITTHYLAALGVYRALYIPNWIYRYAGIPFRRVTTILTRPYVSLTLVISQREPLTLLQLPPVSSRQGYTSTFFMYTLQSTFLSLCRLCPWL